MPRPRGPIAPEPRSERFRRAVARGGESIAQADVAAGPLELAAILLFFGVAGAGVGVFIAKITPWPWDLPYLGLIGLVAGLLMAGPVKGWRVGGRRLGIIGAGLLALVLLCSTSQISGEVDRVQGDNFFRDSCQTMQNQNLPLSPECTRILAGPAITSVTRQTGRNVVSILLSLGTIVGVFGAAILVLIFLRTGNWRLLAVLAGIFLLVVVLYLIIGRPIS